jgi:hypothetical protein
MILMAVREGIDTYTICEAVEFYRFLPVLHDAQRCGKDTSKGACCQCAAGYTKRYKMT